MILRGKNISFSYGNETVFNAFHFELKKGERVVLKGESGSGKSTLFRLILGFEVPDKGEILYRNRPMEGDTLNAFRGRSAWLPQDLNIGRGTVDDVIRFPFRFRTNRSDTPSGSKIRQILSDLGLEKETLQKDFSSLSTGQRQRVGIALCILMDKPVLLLDEPTSALDQSSKEKAAEHLFSDPSRTILSTSHDPFWMEQCTRTIDLDKHI